MNHQSLIILLVLALAQNSALGQTIFNPTSCDYAVTFPGEHTPKPALINGIEAFGAAVGRGEGSSRFAAECWPVEKSIDLAEIAKRNQITAEQRGVQDIEVKIERSGKLGGKITLSGVIYVKGTKIYTQSISYFGKRSRLDLTIVDGKPIRHGHEGFSESVKFNSDRSVTE